MKKKTKKRPMLASKMTRKGPMKMATEGMPMDRYEPKGMREGSAMEEGFDMRRASRKSGPRVI